MKPTNSDRSCRRRVIAALAVAALVTMSVAGCATAQIRHAQKARADLGAYLHTEVAGDGSETLVFLPGLIGSTAYWRSADRSSLSDRRLIFVDLLGFGRSPWPDVEYTLDDQVGALRRTLVRHGATRRVTIVGHSFGTIVGAYYAARFPEDVEHLFLFGTPMYRDREEARRRVGEMSSLAGMLLRRPYAARLMCTVHNAFMPVLSRLAPSLSPELPAMVAHDSALHFWPSLNGSVQHVILGAPLPEALRSVGHKTTIIFGAKDVVSDRGFVENAAAESGARFVLADSDHTGYWRLWPDLLRR